MSNLDERVIGSNIRAWREHKRLTVTALATQAGLTKSTISKIEMGRTSSPISTLIRIAQVLDVPVAEFFVEPDNDVPYVLTRKGKGKLITHSGSQFGYAYETLAAGMRHKLVEPFILTMQPGDPEGEFQHAGQEFIYMLSGKVQITLVNERIVLGAGDALYFDSGRKHKMLLVGKRPARFVDIYIQEQKARSKRARAKT